MLWNFAWIVKFSPTVNVSFAAAHHTNCTSMSVCVRVPVWSPYHISLQKCWNGVAYSPPSPHRPQSMCKQKPQSMCAPEIHLVNYRRICVRLRCCVCVCVCVGYVRECLRVVSSVVSSRLCQHHICLCADAVWVILIASKLIIRLVGIWQTSKARQREENTAGALHMQCQNG